MRALKHLSDLMAVIALVLLVVAIVTSTTVLYYVAAFCFVDAIVLTSMKRRLVKAHKLSTPR